MNGDTEMQMPQNGGSNKQFTVPLAIIAAGALIAGAIYFTSGSTGSSPAAANQAGSETEIEIRPITTEDHILGNPDADIVIVEYSDTECPFCKDFHNTMHQIIDIYGRSGEVAWVYRHFPIPQLHSKAPKQAEATECAAELGGNTAFWTYIDRVFEITPSNNGLDMALLPQIAEDIGLDRTQFEQCLNSGRHAQTIQADFEDALSGGGQGTPHNVIIFGDELIPMPGAQPLATLKTAIDTLLSQANGPEGTQALPTL
jgi:protein-disulfide isomerase